MSDTITITKEEYYLLRCDKAELAMLEAGGVDNWDWYSESKNPEDGKPFTKICDELYEEIFGFPPEYPQHEEDELEEEEEDEDE